MFDATDNRILSQLMLIQGTIDSMPTDESISRFVSRALKSVPGVRSVKVCVRGAIAEKNDLCASCTYQWGEAEDKFDHLCKLEDYGNTKCFSIRTLDRLHGFVVFSLNDTPDAFTPYEPYLQNIANVIAMSIDNRRQRKILQAFNEQLQQEIEHRKQMGDVLQKSEEKYRTILENIQEGYFEVDLTGNFTFFNDSMCRILGYPEEEMTGMNNRQYTDKEQSKIIYQVFNKVYSTGKPAKEFDWQVIRKDGANRYIEVSVSLKINSSGKPIGFRGMARDITERKKNEELITILNEQQKIILDASPAMIFYKDKENRFVRVNEALARANGMSKEEMEGKTMWEMYSKEEAAETYWQDDKEVMAAVNPH